MDSVMRFLPSVWSKTLPEQAKTVAQNISFSQRYSRKTGVRVIVDYDYVDIDGKFWRPLTGLTVSRKKCLGWVYLINLIILEI